MTLLEVTQRLLAERMDAGMSLREIAARSNGAVNHEWLKKFSAGKIDNPGVNSIQALHDCLKTMPASTAA
jgi:transcriptional regulator with XRE-family HTH domain